MKQRFSPVSVHTMYMYMYVHRNLSITAQREWIYNEYTCIHAYHIVSPSPLMQFGTSLLEIIDRKMGWREASSRGKNGYEYLMIEEGKKIIKLLLAHGAETEVQYTCL